jgi:hypothetical protein
MGPLRGPGSKGSEGSEGSKGAVSPWRAMRFIIPLRGMENHTTGLHPSEIHPYPRLWRYFPRRGEVLTALCLKMLMSPKAEWRANLPLRGRRRRRRQKGCISIARQGGLPVFPGRSPVVWFSFRYCHKLKLARCPAPIVPHEVGERWWRQPPKGGAADRQHIYSPLNQPALWAEPIGQCVST